MNLICLMPVRNEDWIVGLTARAVLMWCDRLIVLDHASTDQTPEILDAVVRESKGRVQVVRDEDPTWREMHHRQQLLTIARSYGATHIAMVDADEIVTGNLVGDIRAHIETLPKWSVLNLPQHCLSGDIQVRYASGIWSEQHTPVAFLDDPTYRWERREGYDWHHRYPMGRTVSAFQPIRRAQGGLMHLQFLNERRLRAKQALYKMTEVLRWPDREPRAQMNARYNYAVYSGPVQPVATPAVRLEALPTQWWDAYRPLLRYLSPDATPWQEAACRHLWQEHGAEKFSGLDLFGVVC